MDALSPLDNPIWSAIASVHAPLANRLGAAGCFPMEISPLAAMAGAEGFDDLARLIEPGRGIGLISAWKYDVPPAWDVLLERQIDQMVCQTAPAAPPPPALGLADVPDMVALAQATEPGPFAVGTIRLGRYAGFRSEDGRLMAMAGERMRLDGFTEISAVCTDPAFRGQGLAKRLVAHFTALAFAEGKTPFLHVKTENASAKHVYAQLGYAVRNPMHFAVLRRR